MEALLLRQNELLESINNIKINFSKDSAHRKTPEYIRKRIESLDALWGEFELNHSKIIIQPELAPDYFSKNLYKQGKEFYHATRLLFSSHGKEEKSTQPRGEVDEILALQRTHFRGLNRQISSLQVSEITEKWELEDELRGIQNKWNTIENLHLQIDNKLQGGDLSYESEYTAIESSYKTIKRSLNNKLSSIVHIQQSTPQLEIPTFTGKYSQWPTFYDLFSETIHENNSITKAQKMQHLKGKVKGEAERLIQHLHISSDNYDSAWEILTHRYNNPQVLFSNQVEILLNQPIIIKQSSFELKRLHDTTTECVHGIHSLGVDTNSWDPLLVHLLCKKLDPQTYSDYKEARKAPRELPTLDEFLSFIETKFVALEPIIRQRSFTKVMPQSINSNNNNKLSYGNFKKHFQARATYTVNCPLCKLRHDLFICRKFINLTPAKRLAAVTKHHFCINCLHKHNEAECISSKRCKECQADHNTLLHNAFVQPAPVSPSMIASSSFSHKTQTKNNHNINHVAADNEEILLTTITLNVLSHNRTYVTLRALLDQGSQISLISENAIQILGLQRRHYQASISGIGPVSKQCKGIVSLECQSIYGDYNLQTEALVVSSVINNLPNSSFNKQSWPHLQHLKLADPAFNVSRPIDLLLDASVYSDIIMGGLVKGPIHAPIAQQTKLGWILSGNVKTFNCFAVLNNLNDISKYWEIEDISESASNMTSEEQFCEEFYKNTTRRLEPGQYEVGLPMKPGFEHELGSSKSKAIAQFIKLEKQMSKDQLFSEKYKQFIYEYQCLGHMTQVSNNNERAIILPQHGVWKMDSTTTQLRVVFNASSKTSSGKSLNDLMFCGPNLQNDLLSLILNWRRYKYVITADVEKMFRMIQVRSSDRYLQSIIWRDSPDEPFRTYQLATVTYGTKAAPFLAMRTLQQLAEDDAEKYPLASSAVKSSFYMDDLLTGNHSIVDTKELLHQLTSMFLGAGMNLRKWSSNDPELLKDIPSNQLHSPYEFKCTETRKTLGLQWNPCSDSFIFSNQICTETHHNIITKRQLLSEISKLFDPLGWLSPLTIRAKLLFQRAWASGVTWDSELSVSIQNEWNVLKHDLKLINTFTVPRYVGSTVTEHHLHAFCDASDKAFACAIYFVTKEDKGDYTSKLFVAKTKLAPLSKKVSLPRLELCGALLLSQLVLKVKETLGSSNLTIHAWTDSMVVLGWLKGDISRWKTFVANRVEKICKVIPPSCWHHVRSEENAADCATRGISVEQLLGNSLWWEGPSWLINFNSSDIEQVHYHPPTIETKALVHAALDYNDFTLTYELLYQYSSLTRVVRVVAWISRFIMKIRKHKTSHEMITTTELNSAYDLIIKHAQYHNFFDEINNIKTSGQVHPTSKIYSLNPYIDDHGLLRVGGRLENSLLSTPAKHPIILSSHSRLTDLVIDQAHLRSLHGGPRLTLACIRDRFWIISGLRTVKRQLRMCVKCRRFNHEIRQPIMADLPRARVTPSRPFTHTGVDFTGHVELKANKGRGIKTVKGYISVFVCLSTKAIHLELVSDLGTSAFLAAFRRFCSRRGTPSHVYTDNGTNFVGANRVLKREFKEIMHSINNSDFLNSVDDLNIHWHFNAPAWPSAGGLWEAAVKSLKYHLKRVVGDQKLTYEEFSTFLCQIEACLNSRPLCQLTENPEDDFLTPGHFLIGSSLLSRPHTDEHALTYHSRWQLVQSLMKNFWKRWSSEYLQQLQARSKWKKPCKNLSVGDIVLIKDENQPPGKWALGRIQVLHPGKDGQVRVVTLKTSKNIIQRPVSKLILLPVCTLPNESKQSTQPNDSLLSSSVQVANQNNGTRQRRPKVLKSFLLSLLLLFTFVASSFQQSLKPFNITPIETQLGFYFDKMSDLQLIKDDWKLVVFYNMTTYWHGISDINSFITQLQNKSEYMDSHYDSVITQLVHEVQEIHNYNVILKHQHSNRHKRGLVNGVGYVANSLFGILDERFAEQYNQDIKRIAQNENHLQNLLKNQTSILEAEYSILRRNEDIMHKQFAFINQHLRNVTEELNKVRLDNKNGQIITSSALAANIIVGSLRRIQQTLINTVTDISQGRVDMHVLPPQQLERQIHVISSQLQGGVVVPVDMSSLADLYQIMKASAKIYDNYLIIEIKIPLLSSDKYELDGIITIPQRKDESHSYLISTFPYIAYNLQKDTALFLSEYDLKSCIHLTNNKKLICSLNRPIYNLKVKQSLCNVKLISEESACSLHVFNCRDQWRKLHRLNSWFYACCDVCNLRIYCSSNTTMISLRGNGIIQLNQGCTLKTDSYIIYAHNHYLHQMNIKPNIEVPEVSILNKFVNTSASPDDFINPEYHNSTWNQLRDQITDLKEQSTSELSIHDVHHYSAIYLMLVAILVTSGGVLAYKLIKRNRMEQTSPRRALAVSESGGERVDRVQSVPSEVIEMIDMSCEKVKSVRTKDQGTSTPHNIPYFLSD